MKNILIISMVLLCFSVSAQISFRDSVISNNNFDVSEFDFRGPNMLYNNSLDLNDTVFSWTVRNINVPEEWEVIAVSPTIGVAGSFAIYEDIIRSGDSTYLRVDLAPFNVSGTGSAWMVAWSKLDSTNIDSFKVEITARDLVHVPKPKMETSSFYPNPSSQWVTIHFDGMAPRKVLLYSTYGKLLRNKVINSGEKLDVSDLASGTYVLKVSGRDGFSSLLTVD